MIKNYLDFEKPIYELEQKISELKQFSSNENVDFAGKIVGGIRVRRHSEEGVTDLSQDVPF